MTHVHIKPANPYRPHRAESSQTGALKSTADRIDRGVNPAARDLPVQTVAMSPRLTAQRDLSAAIQRSPRVKTQQQRLREMFGAIAHRRSGQEASGNTTGSSVAVQRVRGGIEYTEDGPTMLYAYPHKPFPSNVAAHNNFNVGVAGMTGFQIGAGTQPNPDLGMWTNQDLDVLSSTANVKLTNDVRSAEWVIERHHADVPADTMTRNLKADMADMFTARDQLASAVNSIKPRGGDAGIATGAQPDTLAAPAVFIYQPGPTKGKVQITAQYSNEDTIRRINKLNVSKYLSGTKVAEGEDAPRISGRVSQELIMADVQGTTSFSRADALLHGLRNASLAIPKTVGVGDRLTQNQVGIIKLMVLNDALATTMVRYQARVGQAQDKDIQRFFPKSRRDEYVKAIAQADLDAAEMTALQVEINRTTAADAQLLYNNADAGALRTDEAFAELGAADPTIAGMIDAKRRLADPNLGPANAADVLNLKDAVLGANGAHLAAKMSDAAWAYTDLTVNASQHVLYDVTKPHPDANDIATYGGGQGGDIGAVIETSRGYTPVVGRGAIYEMREREAKIDKSGWLNIGSLDEVNTAIDLIFAAAD